jgi:hypothetical protein
MSVALMAPTTYPMTFFCEERYDVAGIIQIVIDAYSECDNTRKLPPTIHSIAYMADWIYPYELYHRAMIKDDIFLYGSLKNDIVAALESGEAESVDEYVEQCKDGGQEFEMTGELALLFYNDIEYALKAANLCFVQINDEDEGESKERWDCYEGGKCPAKKFQIFNCPIVGVW